MRIILYATTNSDHLSMDVLALRELRGYDAITFHELADPRYRDQGFHASPKAVLEYVLLEMIEGACIVLHPETEPAVAVQLMQACDLFQVPCLALKDLPDFAPEGEEAIDLFRAEFTGLNRTARKQVQAQEATAPAPAPAPALSPAPAPALSPAPAPAHHTAPSDFTIPQAEVDDEGNIIDRPKTPREWWLGLTERCRRWEARFNARYGQLLKNPVSRQLQEQHRSPFHRETHAPSVPRSYSLQTSKPLTTG